ncbi:hypothetical protein BH10PSE19_BH10PSE19_01570 [soil metagenome]
MPIIRLLRKCHYLLMGLLCFTIIAHATERNIDLNVGYKTVNFAGKFRKAIAVNNQIPAPTLHFKQGDHVIIHVHNYLDKATAIHWHGILIPWQMDGVEGISQKAIPPGGKFTYEFTLHQRGTYWYHAHADVQEQEGLYGAFVIDPPQRSSFNYNKDYVVVLSDWSNTRANKVLANLKKEGDYYSPRFPLQPSLLKFIHDYHKADHEERKKLMADYKMMQQMRMSIYDISDVAYDAYLLNGKPKTCPWNASVKMGDTVRLRFIGAPGSTIYRVKIPDAKMKMVHIQGNDVKPYWMDDFSIAPGETYDVLVKIEKNKPYIIYAESIDTLGKAYGALVTDANQPIAYNEVIPFPEPKPVSRDMMDNMMMAMDHGSMTMDNQSSGKMKHPMDMSSHSMKMNSSHNSMSNMEHASLSMNHTKKMKDMDHKTMGMNNSTSKSSHSNHDQHATKPANMNMHDKKTGHGNSMDHSMDMKMPTEPSIIGDKISSPTTCVINAENHGSQSSMKMDKPKKCLDVMTSGTKYQNLTAAVKTNDPAMHVDGIIRMELFGYMERFIWFINGLPEYRTKPIIIEPNKRYRIIFTNNSMMRHPMHIHGHWFILRNGHGIYDPLLHTIQVPPGATAVADIDTDASGQWFFHCHHLYHMMTGMSRVFQYETILEIIHGTAKPQNYTVNTAYVNRPIVREDAVRPIDNALVHHPMAHPSGFWLANFMDIGADPFNNVQRITFKGLYGPDYHKLELFSNDAEMRKGSVESADLDIFYWHLISQFWAVKGGANYVYRPSKTPYLQPGIGIEGLTPYFINTDIRAYYHSGSAKLDVDLFRDTQITNNFLIRLGIRSILATKTVTRDEVGSGLNQMRYIIRPYYRLSPGLFLFTEFEHERYYGALRNIRRADGEPGNENSLTFGLSVIF